MDKDKKIQILQNKIDNLSKNNNSLREENKRLFEQIHILQDAEKENFNRVRNIVSELNKKKNEYDELIHKCKVANEKYEQLNKEMSQMMGDYKRDMHKILRKKHFWWGKENMVK